MRGHEHSQKGKTRGSTLKATEGLISDDSGSRPQLRTKELGAGRDAVSRSHEKPVRFALAGGDNVC